jgi:UPF0755 protein
MKVFQRGSKGFIVLLLALAAIGASAFQGWQWWAWANAAPARASAPAKPPTKLQIQEGTSAQEIGRDLEALGLIRSAEAWELWTRWMSLREAQGGFKAGTYALSPTESMSEIADKIWRGEVVTLTFTIPEGWSLKRMAQYFEESGFFAAQDFLAATEQLPSEYAWLPQVAAGLPRLEGYLYPDTYQVEGKVTPADVIRQMLDRFEQLALPVYQQQKSSGQTQLTLAQWVTLGSIVEKEAVQPNERPLIAGVFLNRLRQEIPLGADPTVEYGLGVTQTPDQPLTFQQVSTPNPYNTYLNQGLPPTPIASPGLASLKAVLNPATTDYLYFVARYDGSHVFSRTLTEHQAAQTAIHDQRDSEQPARSPGPKPPAPKAN